MQSPSWLEQNAVGLIGHGLTLIGLIAAAGTIVWQVAKQHRNSLELQKENAREALKLQIYEKLAGKIQATLNSLGEAIMYAFLIPIHLESYQYQKEHGFNPSPVDDRAHEFLRLHGEASQCLVRLIEEFENWRIAFPGIELFQTAINVASFDMREAFSHLHSALLNSLPMELPTSAASVGFHGPMQPPPLSPQQLTALKDLVAKYKSGCDDACSYLIDLKNESQNTLLSGLFQREVPPRKPLDPSFKVLSTQPEAMSELMHYFENQTPWGIAKKSTESEVKKQLGLGHEP